MVPFRDSTAVLGDTAALQGRLARDGYLFIRGLIPRDVVMGLAGQALDIRPVAEVSHLGRLSGLKRGDSPVTAR